MGKLFSPRTMLSRVVLISVYYLVLLSVFISIVIFIESDSFVYLSEQAYRVCIFFTVLPFLFWVFFPVFSKRSWIRSVAKVIMTSCVAFPILMLISFDWIDLADFDWFLYFLAYIIFVLAIFFYLYWKNIVSLWRYVTTHPNRGRILLVVIVMCIVAFYSIMEWKTTVSMGIVYSELDVNVGPEFYNLSLKKIVVFAGLMFGSTFLILKAIGDKK